MSDVKSETAVAHDEQHIDAVPQEHVEDHHHHHQHEDHNMGEDEEAAEQQYAEQYEGYDQQHYATGEEGQYEGQYEATADAQYQGATDSDYPTTAEGEYQPTDAEYQPAEGEYQDPATEAYENAAEMASAAAAVAAAAAASAAGEEYADQQVADDGQHYDAEQQEEYQYSEQELSAQGELGDGQTLATHDAASREMDVDGSEVHDHAHDVSQSMMSYDYSSNPDGLQTLAATSSAVGLETPSRSHHYQMGTPMHSSQKPIMPKFNRSRNWSVEETKLLLNELDRIVNSNSEERHENILRSHATFEEIAECLRSKGYSNREGQGCMIRWRNLLRVYKQQRASMAEGNPPSNHQNMQYASAIENIYRFPPDSLPYGLHTEGSPMADTSPDGSAPTSAHTRTWSQANGSTVFATPARKKAREMTQISEHIDQIDHKLDQTIEYINQQSEAMRLLEERLAMTEQTLEKSREVLETLNSNFMDKDAKRDDLEKQLMATVQALSQVISAKKSEDPQQLEQQQNEEAAVEQE
ncbi:hypothetical protein GGI15_000713 [Coemansia interrupta]|uniref:Myb-like domain-containing protein n=1 Tax=Coemansia interrupta TaxID=1126814 RepID=A0A9W8HSM5_9FUNG|nr:hypothetical protein GGI15_000713 [Coemansia interrupta]